MKHSALGAVTVPLFRLATLGHRKGEHITRFRMYERLKHFREPRHGIALTISHSQPLARWLGFEDSQIRDAAYPEYNILRMPFEDASFDAVISDQVLEHVEGNPLQAVDETLRVLKPGGLLVHATCFLNPIHGATDLWRFTPDALKFMVRGKAEVIECGGWGNVLIWAFFALGLRYEKIPTARWHPFRWLAMYNQKRLPVTTWLIARKL